MTAPSLEPVVNDDNYNNSSSPGRLRRNVQESPSTRIRKSLFYKLGVENHKLVADDINPREPSRGSLLGRVTVTTEPLKYDDKEEEEQKGEDNNSNNYEGPLWGIGFWLKRHETPPDHETSVGSLSDSSRSSSSLESKRQIAFDPDVTVIPIPRRDEYSSRIRERLWQGAEEMDRNARRNALEFAAEKWDWRQVLEEDDMYRYAGTGEMIHPVHCEHILEEDDSHNNNAQQTQQDA